MDDNMYYSGNKGIKLFPTDQQALILEKFIIAHKIVYNWSLKLEFDQYKYYCDGLTDKSFLSFIDIEKIYPKFRSSNEILLNIPTHTPLNAVRDMIKGYELFFKFKNINNKPRFKTYNSLQSSFHPRSDIDSFYFENNYIRIEGLPYGQMIKTNFNSGFRKNDRIKFIDPTITKNNRTGEFYLSYKILKQKYDSYFTDNSIDETEPIGIDINKNKMFACSNGMIFYRPDYSRINKHIADLNRKIQNDRNFIKEHPENEISNNMIYRLQQRKKLFEHITNSNKNIAYKASLELIKQHPQAIIMETLNVSSMYKKHYIAKEINTCSFTAEQQIIQEQCYKYNIPVIYAPIDFESSNICSNCGFYRNIGTNSKFSCPQCGIILDRDINAAINLRNWYLDNFQ